MRKFKFLSVILSFMVFLGSFTGCNPNTSSQEPAPAHTCESVCETCGKCTDADCTEAVCADKCQGHTQTPEHTCESVCETCGKCTDADCTEAVCADKCGGHTTTPGHTCESVCETCGKCTDAACTETVCADKCTGHTQAPEHTCESVCATCGKCTDAECNEAVCADKCQGHHVCESVCATCNKCKDLECTEEACEDKCFGHTTASDDWDTFDFNFMSFNINYSNSNSSQDIDATGWTQRKEHVMSLVNNSGAHIIGLQEIAEWKSDSQNQRLYFEQNLAGKYELVYFGDSSHKLNIATVYDKTVFNLLSQELYWMSDTPDVPSSGWDGVNYRAASVLMLEHRATGQKVRAINTHGPLSDEGNEKAFELIAKRLLSDESDTFTFLCGDFNARPNQLGYIPVAKKLQDCRVTAEESPNRDSRTWNGYKDTATGILDYCFVSKHDNVKVLNYRVRDDKWGEGNYLSDHFAVQTTVRLFNNSEKAWSGFY